MSVVETSLSEAQDKLLAFEKKYNELHSRSKTLEKANQNLYDMNNTVEKDLQETASEVSMLCKERCATNYGRPRGSKRI